MGSSASLDRSPKKNWIEDVGGELPAYVREVARSIEKKRGLPLSQAIPIAIATIKRWAAGGDDVKPDTRAKAAKALAEWEALKLKSKVKEAAVNPPNGALAMVLTAEQVGDLSILEGAAFNEAKHPRDPHGKFREKIAGLKNVGDKFALHGIQVSKSGGNRGFRVSDLRGDLGKMSDAFTPNPKSAAEIAVGRSLHSRNPASLGGAKSYTSIADLPGNEAMAPRMNLPGEVAQVADLRRQLQRVNATLKSGKGPQAYAKKRKAEITAQLDRLGIREAAGVTVNGMTPGRTPGQQLAARGKKKPAAKTRSGGNAEFEKQHPRGRGGDWILKAGSKGGDVRAVQRRVGGLKVDGEYGPKTAAAIKAFQKRHGLTVDGKVGHQTTTALAGHYSAARKAKPGAIKDSDRAKLAKLRGHKWKPKG